MLKRLIILFILFKTLIDWNLKLKCRKEREGMLFLLKNPSSLSKSTSTRWHFSLVYISNFVGCGQSRIIIFHLWLLPLKKGRSPNKIKVGKESSLLCQQWRMCGHLKVKQKWPPASSSSGDYLPTFMPSRAHDPILGTHENCRRIDEQGGTPMSENIRVRRSTTTRQIDGTPMSCKILEPRVGPSVIITQYNWPNVDTFNENWTNVLAEVSAALEKRQISIWQYCTNVGAS